MPGEPLVDERVIGVEELQHAAVLVLDRLAEELGLLEHRRPQRLVEIREQNRVGREILELARLQPLSGEVLGQGAGPGVTEHPPGLGSQRIDAPELSGGGQSKELVIGHAAPEEVREPRGQGEIVVR